jgi:hypothetical protein
MINSHELINKINKILKETYPIKNTTFKDIYNLSHFDIKNMYEDLYLPFKMNINGKISSGDCKSYQIIKVNNKSWNKYLKLYLSFKKFTRYPCVFPNFLFDLHRKNKIDILCINTVTISYKNIQTKVIIQYQKNPIIKPLLNKEIKIINKENHFYFPSFQIQIPDIREQIRNNLLRLFMNRDKYKSIHIHLDNCPGGHSSPGQLFAKCLIGNKEEWMTNVNRIRKDGNETITSKWDSWNEAEIVGPNYDGIKSLELGVIPKYETKYSGKIYLHMDKNYKNGSSVWYFITYLIYGFASKIKRFTKKCYGKILKFGKISKDSQLILSGKSSSCSGDGNTNDTPFKDIIISCPTIQNISRSFDEKDWDRFWIGND